MKIYIQSQVNLCQWIIQGFINKSATWHIIVSWILIWNFRCIMFHLCNCYNFESLSAPYFPAKNNSGYTLLGRAGVLSFYWVYTIIIIIIIIMLGALSYLTLSCYLSLSSTVPSRYSRLHSGPTQCWWTTNTGVSMCKSLQENVTYEIVKLRNSYLAPACH